MGNEMQIVPVPATFYDDHAERGLPVPLERDRKGNRAYVRLYDPAMLGLLDDAEYYAKDVDGAPKNIVDSARRTVVAIRKAFAEFGELT